MSMTLNQILNSTKPPEMLEPIELVPEDILGKELEAVCLLGIFNPMGPTLVAINLVAEQGKPSVAILYTSLNPFSQTRLLIARAPNDPGSVMRVLESSYLAGDGLILGGWPTLVLPISETPKIRRALPQMLFGLLNAAPPGEPVSKVLADLRNHRGDPWGRIPSFEEMLLRAKVGPDDSDGSVSEEEFTEWIQLMGDKQHLTSEFQAIMQAWSGAIQNFGSSLSHMPVEEMSAELSALGYPYFK